MKSSSTDTSWDAARQGMTHIGFATLVFALWHSFLCSDQAKGIARRIFGARRGTALYRSFFMAQSAVTAGALFLCLLRQPHRTLYSAQGWKRWLGWSGQLAGASLGLLALRDMDHTKFAGIKGAKSLGEENEIVEAQAQGPDIEANGQIRDVGIFRHTRHPLEWGPILFLLFSPVMKTNWLAFNLVAALYSYFGALHEEKRLLRQGGEAYAKYQQEVPFFMGWPKSGHLLVWPSDGQWHPD